MPKFSYHIEGGSDFAALRKNMVANQIAARGVEDVRVLDSMGSIPREVFVRSDYVHAAYQDRALPIGHDQTISQPYIVALMTEALQLKGSERALEIGTGSGYQTAVLSRLAKEVFTVERLKRLSETARSNVAKIGGCNVTFIVGDGTMGACAYSPFDAIIVTAASPGVPQPLVDQLAPFGRLVIPVGEMGSQELLRVTKDEKGEVYTEELLPVVFVPLIGEHGWRTSLDSPEE